MSETSCTKDEHETVSTPGMTTDKMIEAILFASREPMTVADIAARLPDRTDVARELAELARWYDDRGVNLVQVGKSWAFRTSPALGFLMTVEKVVLRKLSRAALETLAIIAYHQPVTRAEIEEVRGVGVSHGTIRILIECEWISFGQRRDVPGRPVTYVTTLHFLDHFGLTSVNDLPDLEEMRSAGLLDRAEPPTPREASRET